MKQPTLIAILSLTFSFASSQQNVLIFKKRNKTVTMFWKNSMIAFQLKDKEWRKGEITRIQGDSFFIRPVVINYALMGTDTIHFGVTGYSIRDIFAMPKKGFLIDYIDGRFQISRSGGHVHFYWVKSGYIFRISAAVYAGLNIINGVIYNNLSIAESKTPLAIAAAVFLGGVIMHKTYKPTLRIGRKYHLDVLEL